METGRKNDMLQHLKSRFSTEDQPNQDQQIFEYLPSIIYIFDSNKRSLKFVNESRLCEYLGYSLEEVHGWKDSFSSLFFKEDIELVNEQLKMFDTLEADADHTYNCRFNHKAGDWRYFRTRGTVLRRSLDGKPDSMIFIAEDITEQSKSQEEISALKQVVDDTEELLLFGSWNWDLVTGKLTWTDGMYKLLDYNKSDIENLVSYEFYAKHLSDEDAAGLHEAISQAIVNKTDFEHKHTLHTSAKAEKLVSTKAKVVMATNGAVIKVVGITRDITKQTKVNRDLSHYKEMIMEKEEFLNQGSWETSIPDGKTQWSVGMYRLFGYEPDSEGKYFEVDSELHLKHMSESESKKAREEFQNNIETKNNFTREAPIIAKDGSIKRLETYGKVIRDNNGKPEKVIGTTRDVTTLREYERSLEEKIQELNRSNTELEEFAYVASHDLQEPLRKLSTFSERLKAKYNNELGEDGMLYLNRIGAATDNMRILIDNLLEFSRTARSEKHFTSIHLDELLDHVKNDLELKIEETGAIIHTGPMPILAVIPSQIKQLFDNLISNSIKFRRTDQKSIIDIISIKLPFEEIIENNLRADHIYYRITIKDNGIGFEKEYAERIFQIFQRLHGKAEYPGSGIGLAICKKIVENHSGLIFATGEPGLGAVFTVILPESQS